MSPCNMVFRLRDFRPRIAFVIGFEIPQHKAHITTRLWETVGKRIPCPFSDSKNRAMTPESASGASAGAVPQKKTSVEEKEVEEKRRISQVSIDGQKRSKK